MTKKSAGLSVSYKQTGLFYLEVKKLPVEIDIDEKSVTAYISGEIDHHNAAGLRNKIDEAIENAYPEVLVLDFGGVPPTNWPYVAASKRI